MLTREEVEEWREETLRIGMADEVIAIQVADTCKELFNLIQKCAEAYQGVGDPEGSAHNLSLLMSDLRTILKQ